MPYLAVVATYISILICCCVCPQSFAISNLPFCILPRILVSELTVILTWHYLVLLDSIILLEHPLPLCVRNPYGQSIEFLSVHMWCLVFEVYWLNYFILSLLLLGISHTWLQAAAHSGESKLKVFWSLNLRPTVMFSCRQTHFLRIMIMRCLECVLHLWLLCSIGLEPLVLRTSSLIVYTARLVQTKSLATVSTSKMSLSS
jgi:hypothetical protein